MNRRRLAELVGIDPSMVSLIESGDRNASEQVTLRLASALKVELPAILADPNESVDLTAAAAESPKSSTAGVAPVRPPAASAVGAAARRAS